MRSCLAVLLGLLLGSAAAAAAPLLAGFLRNEGMWSPQARFLLERPGLRVWLTDDGARFELGRGSSRHHVLALTFGRARATIGDAMPGEGGTTFLRGGESWRSRWYDEVLQQEIAPAIDARWSATPTGVKYDLIVRPGGDPSCLRLRWEGADSLSLRDGGLALTTSEGELVESAPVCYQEIGGERRPVGCRLLLEGIEIVFSLDEYDRSLPLVIDPAISVGSYLGGSGTETGGGLDLAPDGSIYVTGTTRSLDFPTTIGALRRSPLATDGTTDLFVSRLDPSGSVLLSSTYVGGRGNDEGSALRVAPSGRVVVAGWTSSSDFPTTSGAWDRSLAGGTDILLITLDASLSTLLSGTLIGGSGEERATALAIGNGESPYVVGWTNSADFPTTPGAFTPQVRGGEEALAVRFSAGLDTLRYATLLAGSGDERATAVAVEPGGAAWITGWTRSASFPVTDSAYGSFLAGGRDAFVVRLRFNGAALDYASFFGGSGEDVGQSIAVDRQGGVVFCGRTTSFDLPVVPLGMSTQPGSWFVAALPWPSGRRLTFSRWLGVTDDGGARQVHLDSSGTVHLAGNTNAPLFPIIAPGRSFGPRGGMDVAFVQVSSDGLQLRQSSVLGGSRGDTLSAGGALDRRGNLFVTGTTASTNLPLARFAYDSLLSDGGTGATDAFVLAYAFRSRPIVAAPSQRRLDTLLCDSVRRDTFFVYNDGDLPLTITDNPFRIGGTGYTLLEPTPLSLPRLLQPGDSLRYVVELVAKGEGSYRDTLVIRNSDSTTGRRSFPVAFSAVRRLPALAARPTRIGFAPTFACGDLPETTAVNILNSGSGALLVTSVTLKSGLEFSVDGRFPLPKLLLEREELAGTVLFQPRFAGVRRDTLVVRFAECPRPLLVPVEGIGTLPAILSPEVVDLGELSPCAPPIDTVVTVINGALLPLRITDLAIAPSLANLRLIGDSTVEGGGARGIRITIDPSTLASDSALLLVRGSPCGWSHTILLRWRRTLESNLSFPDTLSFGSLVGCPGEPLTADTVLSLVNVGGAPIDLDEPIVPAPFVLDSALPFPQRLESGDSLRLRLRWSAAVERGDTALLQFPVSVAGCGDTLPLLVLARRVEERLEGPGERIDLGAIRQCTPFVDTTIVLHNASPFPLFVDSVALQGDVTLLRRLPFLLDASSSDTVTLRLTPSQAGTTQGEIVLVTPLCGESLRIELVGRKEGVVLGFSLDTLRFGPLLECAIGRLERRVVHLRNAGNHPSPAVVRSLAVRGSARFGVDTILVGRAIPAGDSLALPVMFTPVGAGEDAALLEVVLDPCGDTLRLPLRSVVEPARLLLVSPPFDPTAVGSATSGELVVINERSLPITIDSIANLVPPFSFSAPAPIFPQVVEPGETLRVAITFRPERSGSVAITPVVRASDPCHFDQPFQLDADAVGGSDTFLLCLGGSHTGLVGETVTVDVTASAPTSDPPGGRRWRLRFDAGRLAFVDAAGGAGAGTRLPTASPGDLLIETPPSTLPTTLPLRLRFRLLAGRGSGGSIRLTSVTGEGDTLLLCGDSAMVTILDRCIVTGLGFGRYANRLEEPVPNPAREMVEITYQQLEDAPVVLRVIDMAGREVLRPLEAVHLGGRYRLRLSTDGLATGEYLLVVEAGSWHEVKRLSIRR